MKIKGLIPNIKLNLLKIEIPQQSTHDNIAISDIVGIVLVLLIIASTVSTILFWGVPYMQDQKAFVAQENALLQFDAMVQLIDDSFAEGVFYADDGETEGIVYSSKTMTFKLSGGILNIDAQGERFVFWYSLEDNIDFNVTNINPQGDEQSFKIEFTEGDSTDTMVDIYYLYNNSLSETDMSIPITGIITTNYSIHDAIQIDVKDDESTIIGRIWLFDAGSINFQSKGSSDIYKAVVENGGVLVTGDKTSGYFFNEPKFLPQTLLDNSSILTMRLVQIKKDPTEGSDSIEGTSSRDVNFWIRPNCSIIKETKRQIEGNIKMRIYGDNDAVSAWRYFYKNHVGFQGDDANEPLYWAPPIDASNVVFTFTHAICYISMEV